VDAAVSGAAPEPPAGGLEVVRGGTRSPAASGSGMVCSTARASAFGIVSSTAGRPRVLTIAPPDAVLPTRVPGIGDAGAGVGDGTGVGIGSRAAPVAPVGIGEAAPSRGGVVAHPASGQAARAQPRASQPRDFT
jgi:hypothetical protein